MSEEITFAIKEYSRDTEQTDAFCALLDYYGKTRLMDITDEMGLHFLNLLKSGDIRIYNEKLTATLPL